MLQTHSVWRFVDEQKFSFYPFAVSDYAVALCLGNLYYKLVCSAYEGVRLWINQMVQWAHDARILNVLKKNLFKPQFPSFSAIDSLLRFSCEVIYFASARLERFAKWRFFVVWDAYSCFISISHLPWSTGHICGLLHERSHERNYLLTQFCRRVLVLYLFLT